MREQTLAVQRMQDYIEQNKTMEITLSDLAKVSLFSPWYSYRLFRDYLGLTPTEYIRKLRLSQAALRLRDGEDKVIDIAFDLGFGSVDTFTRAFFREYGCNPSDYRKNPSPVPLFISYGVKYRNSERSILICQMYRQYSCRLFTSRNGCVSSSGVSARRITSPIARR